MDDFIEEKINKTGTYNGINCGVSCNLDKDILQTCLPLWQADKIDAMEWSFDAIGEEEHLPHWFEELITAYANEGRLLGHGIFYSLFSGRFTEEHKSWLNHLKKVSGRFQFDHFTEHFGFMTGTDFHHGAPMSVPMTPATLSIGRDRLRRLQDACQCPVGLENLAFAFSLEYAKEQGDFLDQLLEAVNGFIILDLHNLYCQAHNFNCSFESLMDTIPLERVREIHISGGSWDESFDSGKITIRRDTHDDSVPEAVFDFLPIAINACPRLKYVILEQIGTGLQNEMAKKAFRNDFLRMCKIVKGVVVSKMGNDDSYFNLGQYDIGISPLEDQALYADQSQLSAILENGLSVAEAKQQLGESSLGNSSWRVEQWDDTMLHTAMSIAQKWRNGHKKFQK